MKKITKEEAIKRVMKKNRLKILENQKTIEEINILIEKIQEKNLYNRPANMGR